MRACCVALMAAWALFIEKNGRVGCQIRPDELANLAGLPDSKALMYLGVWASRRGVGSVWLMVISLKLWLPLSLFFSLIIFSKLSRRYR